MANMELRAGAELDLYTGAAADKHHRELLEGLDRLAPPMVRRVSLTFTADAAGMFGGGAAGPGVEVFTCPLGRVRATLHRFAVGAPGVTPAAPLAAGWLAWYRDGVAAERLLMMLPAAGAAVVPAVVVEGHGAAELHGGEKIVLVGEGFSAGQQIGVNLQVDVSALPVDS